MKTRMVAMAVLVLAMALLVGQVSVQASPLFVPTEVPPVDGPGL